MIIKRVEKEDVIKIIHESSNILASTYDKVSSNLTIIFKNGGQYIYENVKKTDYLQFEAAESVGKAFNQFIKSYPFTKLENVDTNAIITEIEKVKSEAEKAMAELVVKQMKGIITFYEEYNEFSDNMFTDLFNVMNKYKDIKSPKTETKDAKS